MAGSKESALDNTIPSNKKLRFLDEFSLFSSPKMRNWEFNKKIRNFK